MTRRDLILGLAGALAASRLARARTPMSVIGYLHSQSPQTIAEFAAAFRQGLTAEGFTEGKNLKIEYR
jgi:hypothetical protein